MSDGRPITDADLHAAADGCLEPGREGALEAHLAANPGDAGKLAFYRQLNRDLHAVFDPVLAESGPANWTQRPRRRRWQHPLIRVAAALALLLAGAAGGWLLRDFQAVPPDSLNLAQEAAIAHAVYVGEVRHPVEVPGSEEAHLVQWLSKRLGGPVKAPHLAALGYNLMGGRLLPSEDGVAAQFMYENASGGRVTLYIRTGTRHSDTAFRFLEEDGLSVFYWRDASFGYALAAELPRESLLKICNAIYAQLAPDGAAGAW